MAKSTQKRVKIIYLFWNLHTLKCKEKHPRATSAREPPAPGGQGSSGLTPEQRLHIDRVLVDIYNQTSTRYSFGYCLTKNVFL